MLRLHCYDVTCQSVFDVLFQVVVIVVVANVVAGLIVVVVVVVVATEILEDVAEVVVAVVVAIVARTDIAAIATDNFFADVNREAINYQHSILVVEQAPHNLIGRENKALSYICLIK